jgi:hypothetical protein
VTVWMKIRQWFFPTDAFSQAFAEWRVLDVIGPDKIRKITLDGIPGVCEGAIRHFREYAHLQLGSAPYVPYVSNAHMALYFFPTFCVAEFLPYTDRTKMVVFSPASDEPLLASMTVAKLSVLAGENAERALQAAEQFVRKNLPGLLPI